MKQKTLSRIIAFSLWVGALLMAFVLSYWHMHSVRQRAEKVLGTRAAQVAEQVSTVLSLLPSQLNVSLARSVVFTSMNDPSLYAVKILSSEEGLLEGQRRGTRGELEPWDGELIEKTVQAISPILVDGKRIGSVEVYLRVGEAVDFVNADYVQESIRMLLTFLWASLALLLYLCSVGELSALKDALAACFGKICQKVTEKGAPLVVEQPATEDLHNFLNETVHEAALSVQEDAKQRGEQLLVTRTLFAHVFACAPLLLARLATSKRYEELAHLARQLLTCAAVLHEEELQKQCESVLFLLENKEFETLSVATDTLVHTLAGIVNPQTTQA